MVGNFLHYIWLERHTQLVKQCDHHLLNLSAHHFWLLECEDCAWIYGKGSRASLWALLGTGVVIYTVFLQIHL